MQNCQLFEIRLFKQLLILFSYERKKEKERHSTQLFYPFTTSRRLERLELFEIDYYLDFNNSLETIYQS